MGVSLEMPKIWFEFSLGLESAMSEQSEMAERVYDRLAQSDVSAAELVQELCARWGPEPCVPEVHRFVEKVAACLLHHDDVEVGNVRNECFTGWTLEPWHAHDKLAQELLAMDALLDDKERYVFHRTQ